MLLQCSAAETSAVTSTVNPALTILKPPTPASLSVLVEIICCFVPDRFTIQHASLLSVQGTFLMGLGSASLCHLSPCFHVVFIDAL